MCHGQSLPAATADAPWPTYRGSAQRTGNLDGKAGPKEPAVLWSYRAPEHFVASPVVAGGGLYVSGLGAFNTPMFHRLDLDLAGRKPSERVAWTRSGQYFKQPVVCAPAVVEGLLVMGDGMHQTDGATLYCLTADKGLPLWQHPLPGKLIHIEGAPTIDKGRVFVGGGNAGVICVDFQHATLDGKEQDIAAIRAAVEKRWADALARYEKDKQNNPSAAAPVAESLPKGAAKLLWQAGAGKWHVDAALAAAGDFVLVPSAFVDDDKAGLRALLCLRVADGGVAWEQKLEINPWAGVTVAGDTVLVGCSSIRFDRKLIKDAKGEVVAVDLAGGQIKWRHKAGGGVLSPVAVKGDLAIFTATDGKVQALSLKDGQPKWTYDAGAPFFGGPAVAGDAVYAADLKAMLHAVALADGKKLWTLDAGMDPSVLAPGAVFGGPVVHDGQVFLADCDIESAASGKLCAVVCVGDKSAAAAAKISAPAFAVDKARRTITIPCKVAPRKLPMLQEIYPLEVAATLPYPAGQKAHETIVTFDARPSDVQKALEEIGLKPGRRAGQDGSPPTGPELRISLELPPVVGDRPRLVPLERTMVDRRTGKPLPPIKWFFTGSSMVQPDPEKELKVCGADMGGTLITIYPVTDETVIQGSLGMKESQLLKLEVNKVLLGDEGTELKLVIEAK
ncbi:MAG: PQQ-binding-like beta-propeller repeat protein [Phycisphaerae bacterium]